MQYVTSAPETSKVPIVPMGKMLTYSPRLTLAHNCGRRSDQLQVVRAAETFNVSLMFPIVPWETQIFARCLQGGGVAVWGGTVAISSCTISANTARVRAHVQKFP